MRWFLLLLLTISTIRAFPTSSSYDRSSASVIFNKRHDAFSPILRPFPFAAFSGSGSGSPSSNALLLEQLYLPYGTPLDRIPSRPSSRLI